MSERVVECRGHRFVVRADRHAEFWDLLANGTWEPATVDVLEAHLGPDRQFVDIGAWIGPLSLLALAMGARVLAFEPDPVARQDLEHNLQLNPGFQQRITVDARALGSGSGRQSMTGGELGLGASTSRVVTAESAPTDSASVEVVDVQALTGTAEFQQCALLKCDIEGGEYAVLPRLRQYLRDVHPPLLLSLHGYDLLEGHEAAGLLERRRLQLTQAMRRQRLFRALASYEHLYWSANARGDMKWAPLSTAEKARLAFRLSEAELYGTTEAI